MTVRYKRERGGLVPIYVCQEDVVRQGGRPCQSVSGKVVDPAIGALLLDLMTPITLDVALGVQQEVAARLAEVESVLRQQLERARYEAELARRHGGRARTALLREVAQAAFPLRPRHSSAMCEKRRG